MKHSLETGMKVIEEIGKELVYPLRKPRRILFDHLPKCAGTTTEEYLLMHYPRRLTFRTEALQLSKSLKYFQSLPEKSRYRFHLISGHLTNKLLDYVHPDTMTFTIFRDPVDRIISHYFFAKQKKDHPLHDRLIEQNIKLEDYASSGLNPELRNWYTKYFSGIPVEEAEKSPEESVQKAFQVLLKRYDLVGFQDSFPEIMERVRQLAHLHKPFENQFKNKTNQRAKREEVPQTAIEAIADVNFLDVRLYSLLKASEAPNIIH